MHIKNPFYESDMDVGYCKIDFSATVEFNMSEGYKMIGDILESSFEVIDFIPYFKTTSNTFVMKTQLAFLSPYF